MESKNATSAWLWFGALGGAIAWAVHLVVLYPLVDVACATGSVLLLHAVTALTLAVALAAALSCRRFGRVSRGGSGEPAGDGDARPRQRSRTEFMARAGLWLDVLFAVAIVAEWIPVLLLDPCK